jgi:hypothetical protein
MNAESLVRMLAGEQHGVVTAEQCREVGLDPADVKRRCRQREWLRLNTGVYLVNARLDEDPPRPALIMASLLSAGSGAVAVLGTAAELHGMAGLRRDDAIHLSLPGPQARPRRFGDCAVVMHELALQPGQVELAQGMRVTTAVRTAADLLLRVDRMTAVSLLDSGLNRHLLVPDDLDLIRALIAGRRGAIRARPWLLEVDGRAESPLETRVRLRACDGGVAPDELQYRVRDRHGDVVAIGDLAWLRSRLIGEADGSDVHDNPTAIFRDRKRQNDIIAAGYRPIRFTWADTVEPQSVPATVRAAMGAA